MDRGIAVIAIPLGGRIAVSVEVFFGPLKLELDRVEGDLGAHECLARVIPQPDISA